MSRRILMLSEPYPPHQPGGAGRYAATLARALAARGHEVEVVCTDPAADSGEMDGPVAVHRVRVAEGGWNREAFAERRRRLLPYLRGLLDRHPCDLLHDTGGFLYGEVFRSLVLETRLPGVTHLLILMHPYLEQMRVPHHFVRLFHDLQALQCAVSAAVITTSAAEREHYRRLFGPGAPPDTLIGNGVEIDVPDPERVRHWRSVISPDGAAALFVGGRLGDQVKGGDRAIALARALYEGGMPVRLVGSDLRPAATDPLLARTLHSLGRVGDADLPALLQAADAVLAPSRYEAFGLLAAEAAALGTPVIASRTGGHLDTLPALGGGLLLDDHEWWQPPPAVRSLIERALAGWAPRPCRPLPEALTAAGAAARVEAVHDAVLSRSGAAETQGTALARAGVVAAHGPVLTWATERPSAAAGVTAVSGERWQAETGAMAAAGVEQRYTEAGVTAAGRERWCAEAGAATAAAGGIR